MPVKSFREAKNRLTGALSPSERSQLAHDLGEIVLRAAHDMDKYVACDDGDVADWAISLGAFALWTPGLGLSGAVSTGVDHLGRHGFDAVVVAHADLPLVTDLREFGSDDAVTLAPDWRDDGTNVVCVPAHAGFRFSYGPGSFGRHRAEAERLGLPLHVVRDAALASDVDHPSDLHLVAHLIASPTTTKLRRSSREMDSTTDIATPARALAIGAHPDDIEFGCGGTLAKWAESGCAIFHLVCTDGSRGSWDPDVDTAALVVRRHAEQQSASKQLGGDGEVVFLDWPDGELESGLRQRIQVAAWIRRLRPNVVLAHDPWKRYRLHPDHRNAGFLATDGIVAARDPHFFPKSPSAAPAGRSSCSSKPMNRTTTKR